MNGVMEGNPTRMYKAIIPVERKDGTKYWMRIGSAFVNKDASLNVYLDALPAGDAKMIQIREMSDEDFARRRTSGSPPPPPPPSPSLTEDLPF
jgi:hypothetical protein